MGRKVSDIVVSVLTEYIILGLQGDKDTTSSSVIPSVSVTWVRSFDVAVAVSATILTALALAERLATCRDLLEYYKSATF